jgi:hypothetical protein
MFNRNLDHTAYFWRSSDSYHWISSSYFTNSWDIDIGQFEVFAEKLMSDVLLPFAETNLHMMSSRNRRSLCQELHAVARSSWRIILLSKSEMKAVIGYAAHDLMEKHLGELEFSQRI